MKLRRNARRRPNPFKQCIGRQVRAVWPANGAELVDGNLPKQFWVSKRLEHWSKQSALERHDAASAIRE